MTLLPLDVWPREVVRYLRRYGVLTWEELTALTERDVLHWQNVGKTRLGTLRRLMAEQGKSFSQYNPEPEPPPPPLPRVAPPSRQDLAWMVPSKTRGIYFVRAGEFIKIGKAHCVLARYKDLDVSNPILTPLGFIYVEHGLKVTELEKRLHKQFEALWHRGEWFRAEDELLRFIEVNAQAWPTAP